MCWRALINKGFVPKIFNHLDAPIFYCANRVFDGIISNNFFVFSLLCSYR